MSSQARLAAAILVYPTTFVSAARNPLPHDNTVVVALIRTQIAFRLLRIAFDQAGRPFRYFGFRLLQRKPPDFRSPGRRVRFTDDHFEAVRVGCRDRGFDGDCPRRDPAHAQSERDQSNRTHRLFAER